MPRLILYMAMSLDGFIAGPGDGKGNPAGVGGIRLMEWLGGGGPEVADWQPSDRQSQIVFDEILSTGAVITARRTGDFADYRGRDHHDGVAIFVRTHTASADNRHELMPVLLGQGRLLFEDLPPEHIELDLVRTLEAPGVLHLRYEVGRA
jgi:hypothetical protein